MSNRQLYVNLFWHQHQPFYKDLATGKYQLPWVRLHAVKDYYPMVAILDDYPSVHQTFNLVPALIDQLKDYVENKATDIHFDLSSKPAADLTAEEKTFILHNFFMANWQNMIQPFPRYWDLLLKRGRYANLAELPRTGKFFSVQDFRDLQVWFNLSWMGYYWMERDEMVKDLVGRGKNFTEEDKQNLLNKQLEIMGLVVAKYQEAANRGQIEVTTSPYYHCILPLICNTDAAHDALPNLALPQNRFNFPEDASVQLERGMKLHQQVFGQKPKGLWPSEGSVSEEIIPLVNKTGVNWMASDESVLFHSLASGVHSNRTKLYQPYIVQKNEMRLNMVFRDHQLSDFIGFTYSRWDTNDAVKHFIGRLSEIYEQTGDLPAPLVSIILDGENCWEFYCNNGKEFLHALYTALSLDSRFKIVTVSEYLEQHPAQETLPHLWSGSWINYNYSIWIGHPEDNLAWDYLYKTREALHSYLLDHPEQKDQPNIQQAWEEIYIAEGSDWCWWFGDEHTSGIDDTFDRLFRDNLAHVFELIGQKRPEWLKLAIKGRFKSRPIIQPIDFITPKIDGAITSYFEWRPAGFYPVEKMGGTMHQSESLLLSFHYGFDLENFYLRLDPRIKLNDPLIKEIIFKVVFLLPEKNRIEIKITEPLNAEAIFYRENQEPVKLTAASKKIIELALPFNHLEVASGQNIEFMIVVEKNGLELEQWPFQGSVIFSLPTEEFSSYSWE